MGSNTELHPGAFLILSKDTSILISSQALNILNCLPFKQTPSQQAQNYLDTVLPQTYWAKQQSRHCKSVPEEKFISHVINASFLIAWQA